MLVLHEQLSTQFAIMKFSTVAAALLPLASAELYTKEEYRSGAVMAMMMEAKEVRALQSITTFFILMNSVRLGSPPSCRRIQKRAI